MAGCAAAFLFLILSASDLMASLAPRAEAQATKPGDGQEEQSSLVFDRTQPGPSSDKTRLLVFAQETNSSEWLMIEVNLNTGKSHSLLKTQRDESIAQCGFALTNESTVVFYNGMVLETWSLKTGKITGSVKIEESALQTVDFNPGSQQIEGVCQMWLPEQNMSATCWCAVHESNISAVYQMPVDYFGESRSACVNYIDQSTSLLWYPGAAYNNVNKFFAGLGTSSQSSVYDWKWFGAINGTTAYDVYAYDDNLNRSFSIQISPENTTSQLVEVFHGIEPYAKDNPQPKVLHVFPDNFGLSAAGSAAYDQSLHTMYAIMERHTGAMSDAAVNDRAGNHNHVRFSAQYLVKIDVVTLKVTLQEITWPQSAHGFSVASVRLRTQSNVDPRND
ncbi:uncharacterized protein LOC135814382 [Sycon ciliatum]|uniref:uncharacterized protein LOC135814382 n=1 Tax=Sycon ciliatum TaxID=27933 RepID=UPI0031F6212E